MRNCFIPKCDNLCKNSPRRMMFMAPKDTEMFLQWKRVLPNKREFKRMDKVCERHFTKDDIMTTFDHIINGKLLQMERGRPRLKPNAVPSLNLEIDPKILEKPPAKRNPRGTAATRIVKRDFKNITTSASEEEYVVPTEPPEVVDVTIEPEKSKKECPPKEQEIETMEEESVPLEQYESLYDDVFEVTLPSTLWGIHREPERRFIAFTSFDIESMQNNKCVVLHSNGCLKVSLHRKKLSEQVFNTELNAELISQILNEIEETRPCAKYDPNGECKLLAREGSEFCGICSEDD